MRTFINWLFGRSTVDFVNLSNLDTYTTMVRWDADAKFRSRLV